MPPMTSMVASKRPSRRASGCELSDPVCDEGEFNELGSECEILREASGKRWQIWRLV